MYTKSLPGARTVTLMLPETHAKFMRHVKKDRLVRETRSTRRYTSAPKKRGRAQKEHIVNQSGDFTTDHTRVLFTDSDITVLRIYDRQLRGMCCR